MYSDEAAKVLITEEIREIMLSYARNCKGLHIEYRRIYSPLLTH
jgi:hypothetical protein